MCLLDDDFNISGADGEQPGDFWPISGSRRSSGVADDHPRIMEVSGCEELALLSTNSVSMRWEINIYSVIFAFIKLPRKKESEIHTRVGQKNKNFDLDFPIHRAVAEWCYEPPKKFQIYRPINDPRQAIFVLGSVLMGKRP